MSLLYVYLLMAGFAIKQQLNLKDQIGIIETFLRTEIEDFDKIFDEWQKIFLKNMPTSCIGLNSQYKIFSSNMNDTLEEFNDYNALVDSIISISPQNKNMKSN